jgi:hypothetical protein
MRSIAVLLVAAVGMLLAETAAPAGDADPRVDSIVPVSIDDSASLDGIASDSSGSPIALASVYCYPNPFVRGWGHTQLTFTGLYGRVRIRVFDTSGFPLFDQEVPASNGAYTWDARTRYGQDLPVGFYFYVVTLESAQACSGVLVVAQ